VSIICSRLIACFSANRTLLSENGAARVHGQAVMLRAGDRQDVDARCAFQQVHGVQVGGVDIVDLARDQRVLARRVVEDRDLLEPVEIGQAP
jgi:hypothetical protein